MSGGRSNLLTLERDHYKYLFLTSYFDLKDNEHVPSEPMAFIRNYLNCSFELLDDTVLMNYLNYLQSMQLKFLVGSTSSDIYKFVKPQFRFVCDRTTVDILEFDTRMYIKPGTPVYATNLFTSNPRKMMAFLYAEFGKVFKNKIFVNINNYGCVLAGSAGFVFDDAYVDWNGVRMCAAPRLDNNMHPFRLYLLGEDMAKHFVDNNILPPHPSSAKTRKINNSMFMLKNFYKGLPLFKSKYTVVNSTKIVTRKPNDIFNEIDKELNGNCPFIKFIQRDYIFDAQFPSDLLDLLNEYMTKSAIMKIITKFVIEENPAMNGEMSREIIIDRYSVDNYRKLYIKMEITNQFPVMYDHESSYIFVSKDFLQLKGTLNAFYAPKQRILSILAVNRLFGATETIDFHPNLLVYRQSSPPVRLTGDVYVVDKNEKVFLVKHVFSNTVPAYLLIRGDYESSSELKSLRDLNPWVQNTLLKLLIPDSVQ
ncbi:49k protein [Thysanoplusia orichalcea nucleopolyhedrovirus]|uniref:49k protein n=1 Tax=Thysanoplusia orichalcea nucleopolyhedrovirus TaxID=101850 RepID=L0CJX0_9ABAC|nr:49k protein [Thysanoplusia orichalcea nucleopolyhedrovirus]AGA16289.1 49k protein [Thysanoplusia orichalcea nucleopolyhedrovirus]